MITFGSGALFANPNAGNLATNPTPQQALTLQSVSVDMDVKMVELRGAMSWPEDVATSDKTGKFKFGIGRDDQEFFNQIFFADATSSGTLQIVANEPQTVPASGGLTCTVINSTNFATDLGVRYASGVGGPYGNAKLERVLASPAVGQYTVSAGVYTFSSEDEGVAMLISYNWNSTVGTTVTVNNQLQGFGPVFEMLLLKPYQNINVGGKALTGGLRLFSCRATKLGEELKRDGYMMPTIEGSYFANPAGQVMQLFNPGL